jgi:predicted flavoprotein YhiN
MSSSNPIIVIGAGAAGMMAAGRAAELGAEVIVVEKMDRPGKKVLITGNGRCNLSNSCDIDTFMAQFGDNGRFLVPAFKHFFRDELLALMARYGVRCKTKPNGKIYPRSDSSHDVVRALELYMSSGKVDLRPGVRATGLLTENGTVCGVSTSAANLMSSAVVLAAGGSSHPQTGSTGDGFALAVSAGHTLTTLRPGLVPLVVKDIERYIRLEGAGLRGVRVTAFQCPATEINASLIPSANAGRGFAGKSPGYPVIESRTGDAVVTPFGLSGPVILEISISAVKALQNGPVSVSIDLIPNRTIDNLMADLRYAMEKYRSNEYRDILKGFLPQKLIKSLVAMTGMSRCEVRGGIFSPESESFIHMLKSLRFDIERPYSMATAVVTGGGVPLQEIAPQTMGSKITCGLYFCGEVMDLEAGTGGYNLQAAFSTGYVAGENAAGFVLNTRKT